MRSIRQISEMAHYFASAVICPGDQVVDATAGNGFDTLFLARAVGLKGFVYAFDIQEQALKKTAALLQDNNLAQRVRLIHDSHENIRRYLNKPLKAALYNLGYLPGGDKNIKTEPETTLASLKSTLELLADGGLVCLAVYPGHEGGPAEIEALTSYLSILNPGQYSAARYSLLNKRNEPPFLLVVQKEM